MWSIRIWKLHKTSPDWRTDVASTYKIFRTLPSGDAVWIETVKGLENARERLLDLVSNSSFEHFIWDPSAGEVIERIERKSA